MNEARNPIPADVTLHDLVVLIDMHSGVLVNPMELYPHLVASVGRFKARLMWAAALLIVMVRDECRAADASPAEMLPGVFAVVCGLLVLFLDGAAQAGFLGAAIVFGLVSLCHGLARVYREGDL